MPIASTISRIWSDPGHRGHRGEDGTAPSLTPEVCHARIEHHHRRPHHDDGQREHPLAPDGETIVTLHRTPSNQNWRQEAMRDLR